MNASPRQRPADSVGRREHLRRRVHRYLNLPVALASILFVLVAFVQISGTGHMPWRQRFWHGPPSILLWLIWAFFIVEFCAKLALAPRKPLYLRRHWFDAVVALLPAAGVLRAIDLAIIAPLVRLVTDGAARPHLAILARRKLGRLALVSVLVILIAAVLAYIFESGARGTTLQTFGDALWWAAATATTVGNQLYPVTTAGEILAFLLMLFAIGVFSYLTSSIASALIGGDAAQSAAQANQPSAEPGQQAGQESGSQTGSTGQSQAQGEPAAGTAGEAEATMVQVTLSPSELAVLRAILDRAQQRSSGSH